MNKLCKRCIHYETTYVKQGKRFYLVLKIAHCTRRKWVLVEKVRTCRYFEDAGEDLQI